MAGIRTCFYEAGYKQYGNRFAERQMSIIYGDGSIEATKQELSIIIKKALALEQHEIVEMVEEKYGELIYGYKWVPKYTVEEAMQVLQSMCPFPINWDAD